MTKVYKWEDQFFQAGLRVRPELRLSFQRRATKKLQLHECEDLVRRVFERYARPLPLVTDGRRRRRGAGNRNRIALPRFARTPYYVLHECAHGLADWTDSRTAYHGPEFMAHYAWVCELFLDVPHQDFVASARAARLKVAPLSYRKPPSARKVKRITELEKTCTELLDEAQSMKLEITSLTSEVLSVQEIPKRQGRKTGVVPPQLRKGAAGRSKGAS